VLGTPLRTCVGCRAKGEMAAMTRYVQAGGQLVRDDKAQMPGRGAWVHDGCYELALRRGGFKRAFRSL